MAWLRSALLVLCSALLLHALSPECEWISDGKDLSWLSLTRGDVVEEMKDKDLDSCRAACCESPDCDMFWVGPSTCTIIKCQTKCELKTGAGDYQVYRKKQARIRTDQDQIYLSPLLLPPNPEHRETSNQTTEGNEPGNQTTEGNEPGNQTTEGNEPGNQTTEGNKEGEEKWSVLCRLPKKVGLCRAAFPKYFYDPVRQTCQRFIYGGCGGNTNNFESMKECEQKCTGVTGPVLPDESTPAPPLPVKPADQLPAKSVVKPSAPGSVSSGRTVQCLVSPDPGPCRAAFPKFYYDPNTGTCQGFIYGGCRGNQNRYDTAEECLEHCGENGVFGSHGKTRDRWTAGVFLFISLAAISALLLGALIITTLRRHRLPHRPTSISDKEELLPDDSSSVDSLSMPAPRQA